jgi:hypothetical protein
VLPKEHGAYGQLLFPMATALAIGRPGAAAFALAAAAVCVFLAHEPLLVLLGLRGPRARRDLHRRAVRWISGLAVLALGLAGFAIATTSAAGRLALVPPAVLALTLGGLIIAGREHTLIGEAVSAITLSSIAYPIALSSSVSRPAALTCASAFATAFVTAVVCVHGVIAFTRQPPAVASRAAGAAVAIGGTIALGWAASVSVMNIAALWAAIPSALAGCLLVAVPPSARRLRSVGWTLVATSTAAALVLIAVFR